MRARQNEMILKQRNGELEIEIKVRKKEIEKKVYLSISTQGERFRERYKQGESSEIQGIEGNRNRERLIQNQGHETELSLVFVVSHGCRREE